jgi:XTP/dITP diphosphohydrolase
VIRSAQVLLATRSEGKLRELRPLFAAARIRVEDLREAALPPSPDEETVEAFDTFEANALAKARYFHALTGRPVVADDSGLEVEALHGAPGVRSKRWSGRDDLTGQALDDANNATLMDALRSVTDASARYVCAAAFVDGAREEVAIGVTAGAVIREPRGEEGFGYDPYFMSAELGATFGERSREEKERVSHRGRAFRALLEQLRGHVDNR